MSLEQAIQENTAAIRDLIRAIKEAGAIARPDPHAEDDAYRRGLQAARDAAKAAEKPAEPKPAAPAPAPAGDYTALRNEVRDLVFRIDKAVSRQAALSVLKAGDAERVPQVTDEKLHLVKAAAEKLLAEHEAKAA